MATLHPFVVYYRPSAGEPIKHDSFLVISECNEHDIFFQFIFSKSHFFPTCILHDKFVNISKLYYMSDGCAAQYKNRNNFINLTYHFSDFGVLAVWDFHPSSHGKGPCDGLGGSI